MQLRASLLALAATLTAASLPASAGALYGHDNQSLYSIDNTTGAGTLVASIFSTAGNQALIDMTASGSTLLALVQEPETLPSGGTVLRTRIATIDATTGATVLAPLITGITTTGGAARKIDAIAFNAADGRLYGVNNGPNRSLYTIDAATGVATLVGALASVSNQNLQIRSLSFDGSGMLLAGLNDLSSNLASTVLRIDPLTGAQATLGSSVYASLADLAWDSDDGVLYGGGYAANLGTAVNSQAGLYRVDGGTGEATLLGFEATSALWAGLAVLPQGAVPEPASALLALAALGLLSVTRRASAQRAD